MVKRDKQFVSSLSMSEDEVSSILDKKIFEEKEKAKKIKLLRVKNSNKNFLQIQNMILIR